MFDSRCWNCPNIDYSIDSKDGIYDMYYLGKGVFKCPHCGYEEKEYMRSVYTILFSVIEYINSNGKPRKIVNVVRLDSLLNSKPLKERSMSEVESILEEIAGQDLDDEFDKEGFYQCDVLWYMYKSGGPEDDDYDMEFEILSKTPVALIVGSI